MIQSYIKIALRSLRKNRVFSFVSIIGLTLGIIACNTLNSALTVQPGKQFKLGGNQKGGFTVRLKNTGDVPVTISEQRASGEQLTLGTFRPGEGQTVRFTAGLAALVDNTSARPAQLNLVVTGDKDLSMRESSKQ